MKIGEATFVVVDVETTGLSNNAHRVIEIAAVKIRARSVKDTFHTIVNPEGKIPAHITRLTGITTAHVSAAPTAGEILPEFVQFLGDDIFVAHNLRFDYGFINAELERAGLATLTNSKLCTVRLARRLLRGLPSKGLDSLIAFYGLEVESRHRAQSDAEAAAMILMRLLDRLQTQHKIQTVPELLAFQGKPYSMASVQPKHLVHLREKVLPLLPDVPGVYFMRGHDEALLYVGKARHLGRRVRSYFTGIEGCPAHIRELVRRVRTITWEATRTELQAMLLESRYIKEAQPRFNRTSRQYRNYPFLRLGLIQGAPWLTVINHIRQDGAAYYGPLSSRQEAESVAEALIRLHGATPSSFKDPRRIGGIGLTAARIGGRLTESGAVQVAAFLRGDGQLVLEALERRMLTASQALKYEWASRYRNWIGLLRRLMDRSYFVGQPLFERHGVALLQQDETVEVHFFVCGRPIDVAVWPADASLLREQTERFMQAVFRLPEHLSMQQVDEVHILAHWMHDVRKHLSILSWVPGSDTDSFAGQLNGHLA